MLKVNLGWRRAVIRRREVCTEEVKLLLRRHEYFRVLSQVSPQRRGTAFGCADNEEIGSSQRSGWVARCDGRLHFIYSRSASAQPYGSALTSPGSCPPAR